MPEDTLAILEEQATKLPSSVVSYLSSSDWDTRLNEIARASNLTPEQASGFKTEVVLVLSGLTHPDMLAAMLINNAAISSDLAATLADETEGVINPIRPVLVKFFDDERVAAYTRGEFAEEFGGSTEVTAAAPAAEKVTPVGATPANIPTEIKEEEKPLIPPIPPKTSAPEATPTHPFEEKLRGAMPATFTPALQTPATPEPVAAPTPAPAPTPTPAPATPSLGTLTHDPYREPIE